MHRNGERENWISPFASDNPYFSKTDTGRNCTVDGGSFDSRASNNQNRRWYRSDNLVTFEDGVRITSKHSRKYPFSSKIQCGFCGDIYTRRTWHSGSKYQKIIWSCLRVSRETKEACPESKGIPEEEIEKAFIESYKHLCGKDIDLIEKFLSRVEEVLGEKAIVNDLKKVKLEINKLNDKKKRLVAL